MLKQLINLFAEKFLVSRREWIGRQAFPSSRTDIDIALLEYVPTSDGYIGFYRPNTSINGSVDIYAYGVNWCIVSRYTFSTDGSSYTVSGTIPVKKGYTVKINGEFSELWFSPCVGSS